MTATALEDLDAFQKDLAGTTVIELGIEAPRLGRTRQASDREGDDVRRYLRAGQVWEIGADDDPRDGRPASYSLYTHFELALEDEDAVARGDLDLAQIVSERRGRIAPFVTAIDEQVQVFLARDLPNRLLELAGARRRELANRQAVRDNLSFPEDWLGGEPELEDSRPAEPSPAAERDPEPRSPQSEEVHLNPRSRLSRVTFEDVLFSLRHWANAVERYPAAFGVLAEDRISDLLAATWNATLPGARRGVYSRGGKSDIFIQADVLDPGRGPATVFICEAKWATAHDVIREAVNPQLFGYLNVHDTAAIFLVLMRQKDFAGACARGPTNRTSLPPGDRGSDPAEAAGALGPVPFVGGAAAGRGPAPGRRGGARHRHRARSKTGRRSSRMSRTSIRLRRWRRSGGSMRSIAVSRSRFRDVVAVAEATDSRQSRASVAALTGGRCVVRRWLEGWRAPRAAVRARLGNDELERVADRPSEI